MKLHNEIISGTTSSGSFSTNTARKLRGIIRQIICKPATETTTYDIKIVNDGSRTVYERTNETGTVAEEVSLPALSIYTVTVSGASADEAFTVELVLEE